MVRPRSKPDRETTTVRINKALLNKVHEIGFPLSDFINEKLAVELEAVDLKAQLDKAVSLKQEAERIEQNVHKELQIKEKNQIEAQQQTKTKEETNTMYARIDEYRNIDRELVNRVYRELRDSGRINSGWHEQTQTQMKIWLEEVEKELKQDKMYG
jgi:hypothetical protein